MRECVRWKYEREYDMGICDKNTRECERWEYLKSSYLPSSSDHGFVADYVVFDSSSTHSSSSGDSAVAAGIIIPIIILVVCTVVIYKFACRRRLMARQAATAQVLAPHHSKLLFTIHPIPTPTTRVCTIPSGRLPSTPSSRLPSNPPPNRLCTSSAWLVQWPSG